MTPEAPTTVAGRSRDRATWRDALLRAAAHALDAQMSGLALAEGGSWALQPDALPASDRIQISRVREPLVRRVLQEGEAVWQHGDDSPFGIAVLPILAADGGTVGCIWVARVTGRPWEDSDHALLASFARALSQELEHIPLQETGLRSTHQQEASYFRALFDTAPFGILIGDLRAQRFETNPAWRKIFWWWEGNPFEDVVRYSHPDDLKRENELYEEMLAGKRTLYRIEKRYLAPGEEILWGDLTIALVRGKDGGEDWLYTTVEDITERKRLEAELERASAIDELTGLANRRGFFAHAERELQLARRRGEDLLAVYIDLDDFKTINDTFGHAEGDRLLQDVAHLVQSCFRETDISARLHGFDGAVARVGGDEFVVLAPGARPGAEEVLTERLQTSIDRYNRTRGRPYDLSLSFGIARHTPESATASVDDLLAQADRLMYRHKRRREP